jgi:hypothetical protein
MYNELSLLNFNSFVLGLTLTSLFSISADSHVHIPLSLSSVMLSMD